jgi:membrane protease YdiL (CAAX protease family)
VSIIRRYPLASFFLIAYAITWTLQLAGIALATRYAMSMSNETNFGYFLDLFRGRLPSQQALTYGLFSIGAGPLFSAIIVTAVTQGREGLKDLWQRCTKWNLPAKWYLIVLGLPLLLSALSVGIGLLSSAGKISYAFKLPPAMFVPFFLYMLVFTGIAEEPGWRGFALPRLQSRHTAENASWILGMLWGLWHFPFIVYYGYAQGIAYLLVALLGLTFGIVGWTIVNTWIYNSTQSVWLIILLHGWGNAVQSYLVLSSDNGLEQFLYGLLPWGLAIILLRVYGKQNLASVPRHQIRD